MPYNPTATCKMGGNSSSSNTAFLESTLKSCQPHNRFYAKEYGYVGGAYELCGEDKMMQEVHEHGPIAIALEAPRELFGYNDGIFDAMPSDHHRYCASGKAGLNGWEYTNHALVVVGWGEDGKDDQGEPMKYWIVRNSWGDQWGNKGYVKIRRGKNLGGIESQAVYLDPDLTRGRAAQVLKQKSIKPHAHSESDGVLAVSAGGDITP
eukprot:GHVN01065375.1.p2 GENE.GHVN01065375.1~~GHVN01065375.1.p2  ORF type:complete len:207 (-),score=29.24 GHVN01065375.1:263-883(-)